MFLLVVEGVGSHFKFVHIGKNAKQALAQSDRRGQSDSARCGCKQHIIAADFQVGINVRGGQAFDVSAGNIRLQVTQHGYYYEWFGEIAFQPLVNTDGVDHGGKFATAR